MNNNNIAKSSYELFGIECGDGWKELYQPIIDYIILYNSEHEKTDSRIYINQIKEKFGGLRFYWSGENLDHETCDILSEMVRKAGNESYKVCESCGSRKNVGITVDGWYTTICRDCIEKAVRCGGLRERKWKSNDDDEIYEINKEETREYIK